MNGTNSDLPAPTATATTTATSTNSTPGTSTVNGERSETQQPVIGDPAENSSLVTCHLSPAPFFPRSHGESLRAFNAFITFFQLGHNRTRQAVADKLHESIDNVKKWSTKFDWTERIHSFNSGLLLQRAKAEAEADQQQAAERSALMSEFRRREWGAAKKMLSTVEFYLENCDEEHLETMTLGQVAQALSASSSIGRLALSDSDLPEAAHSAKSAINAFVKESLQRVYGKEPAPEPKDEIRPNSKPLHVQN